MSLSKKGTQTKDGKFGNPVKVATLNPNAAEFIPFALRSSSFGSTSTADVTSRLATSGSLGKAVLDRSESSVSKNSDEEAHQYWCQQLPDDITPDFKVMGEDESQGIGNLSLAGLSLHDEASRLPASKGGGYMLNEHQELSSHSINGNSFAGKVRFSASSHGEDASPVSFLHASHKPWDNHIVNSNQLVSHDGEGSPYDGNSQQRYMNNIFGEHAIVEDNDMNPVEFLVSQFPGFATESLAEVYFANGCDLNLTIEMLTQLEVSLILLNFFGNLHIRLSLSDII